MLSAAQPLSVAGRVRAVRGLAVSVADFPAPVGSACRIVGASRQVAGRVIGFAGEETLVMPLGAVAGICRGDRVVCSGGEQTIGVGEAMLGRVIDAAGEPIDGGGPISLDSRRKVWPEPLGAMRRRRITDVLPTGVRAIDAVLTVGRGQRMSILSGSGVGKSVLLGMIARHTAADVVVVALIGERGREVRDFIEKNLGDEGLRRAVVVVSTSDEPPVLRVQAAAAATAAAEHFRDRGRDVLLVMDSLSRLATAQRQIGLAAGEPPATKGFPPSVFSLLPELLERAGRLENGSITAFYTVLAEGDDVTEPVSDCVRAVTDGHVHLSRRLANGGCWPAIDVLGSVSRLACDVADEQHTAAAQAVRALLASHAEIEDLLAVGAYQAGANAEHDLAVKAMPAIRRLLTQKPDERAELAATRSDLVSLAEQLAAARGGTVLLRRDSLKPQLRRVVPPGTGGSAR
jgi:FliI/YscN family ATPase